jgi:hypothetical protein
MTTRQLFANCQILHLLLELPLLLPQKADFVLEAADTFFHRNSRLPSGTGTHWKADIDRCLQIVHCFDNVRMTVNERLTDLFERS